MFGLLEKIRLFIENTLNNPYVKSKCVYCDKQVIERKQIVEKYVYIVVKNVSINMQT